MNINLSTPWQTTPYNWDTGTAQIETIERGQDVPSQGYPVATVYNTNDLNVIVNAPAMFELLDFIAGSARAGLSANELGKHVKLEHIAQLAQRMVDTINAQSS